MMLKIQNKKNTTSTFLEKVAMFDFDKYYTSKVRVTCHIAMWMIFSLFILLNLLFDFGLEFPISIAFSIRSLICNTVIFYLFFYLILPQTLYKNKIFFFILLIPICCILFVILNHYCIVFIGILFKTNNLYFKSGITTNREQSFWDVISLKNIIAQSMNVFYALCVFFFVKILFDIIRYYSTVFKTQRKANQLEIEKLNLESDFLKAQLNPHFLFNTLNNLYGMAIKKNEYISDTILQLSSIMRYTLYESNTQKVSLPQELAFIKSYISLEKLRYGKDKKITLDIDETNIAQQQIAPLLTFVFVENAFKYGLKSRNNSFLEIKIFVVDKIFYFSVANDKDSDTVNTDENGKIGGIGIENIKKRLELLYPNKYQLTINNEEKYFYVQLQIEME